MTGRMAGSKLCLTRYALQRQDRKKAPNRVVRRDSLKRSTVQSSWAYLDKTEDLQASDETHLDGAADFTASNNKGSGELAKKAKQLTTHREAQFALLVERVKKTNQYLIPEQYSSQYLQIDLCSHQGDAAECSDTSMEELGLKSRLGCATVRSRCPSCTCKPQRITAIATQGSPLGSELEEHEWVSEYLVSFLVDGDNGKEQWKFYDSQGLTGSMANATILRGGASKDDVQKNFFALPVIAKAIRVHPVCWYGRAMSLRVEVFQCLNEFSWKLLEAKLALGRRGACHITMAGWPSRASSLQRHAEECTPDSSTAAVRCCDDNGKGYSKVPSCNRDKPFAEAAAICSASGKRLCEKNELDRTKGTGCGFDNQRTWTSSTDFQQQKALKLEVNSLGEGRRGGAFLSTTGSFTLSSGNRAGNSERQKNLGSSQNRDPVAAQTATAEANKAINSALTVGSKEVKSAVTAAKAQTATAEANKAINSAQAPESKDATSAVTAARAATEKAAAQTATAEANKAINSAQAAESKEVKSAVTAAKAQTATAEWLFAEANKAINSAWTVGSKDVNSAVTAARAATEKAAARAAKTAARGASKTAQAKAAGQTRPMLPCSELLESIAPSFESWTLGMGGSGAIYQTNPREIAFGGQHYSFYAYQRREVSGAGLLQKQLLCYKTENTNEQCCVGKSSKALGSVWPKQALETKLM